ncbi:unnamed protein product, partial [Prunus brigantina]
MRVGPLYPDLGLVRMIDGKGKAEGKKLAELKLIKLGSGTNFTDGVSVPFFVFFMYTYRVPAG